MKILIGNNSLAILAGSETFAFTLACQFKKLGHEVYGFSPELGIISDELKKKNIRCFNQISTSGVKPFSFVLEEKQDFNYDVIIASHWHIVEYLRSQFPKTPIISTIHGILHFFEDNKTMAPEHPAMTAGVNQFVAVSEEVRDMLKKDYNIDAIIVRNFIDLERFKTKRKISKSPKQILVNTNYHNRDDEEIKVLRDVAKHYNAKLTAIGVNFTSAFDIKKALEDADIVVGLGRSVLEGVTASRLGIVHGRWGTGGIINEGNIDDLRFFNFSGRNSDGKIWTKEKFIEEIDKNYNQKTIEWGKKYIGLEHNAAIVAESFLRIAKDLLGQNINKPEVPLRPYRRQKDVIPAA